MKGGKVYIQSCTGSVHHIGSWTGGFFPVKHAWVERYEYIETYQEWHATLTGGFENFLRNILEIGSVTVTFLCN